MITDTPGGYVKLWRKLLGWEWIADPNVVAVFFQVLLRVNWEPKRWQGIDIPAGSFLTSHASLAEKCGLTEKQVRRSIDVLKQGRTISTTRAGFGQLVTLTNWEEYQERPEAKGRKKAGSGAGTGQEQGRNRATTEEGKEGEEVPSTEGTGGLFNDAPIDPEKKTTMRASAVGGWDVFKSLPTMREAEAVGVDVSHYFQSILRWSDRKTSTKRTAQGWVSTVEGAMARDKAAGKLVLAGAVDKAQAKTEALIRFMKIGTEHEED